MLKVQGCPASFFVTVKNCSIFSVSCSLIGWKPMERSRREHMPLGTHLQRHLLWTGKGTKQAVGYWVARNLICSKKGLTLIISEISISPECFYKWTNPALITKDPLTCRSSDPLRKDIGRSITQQREASTEETAWKLTPPASSRVAALLRAPSAECEPSR